MTLQSPASWTLALSVALPLALATIACTDDGGEDDEVGEDTGSDDESGSANEEDETGESDAETGGPDREALIAELEAPGPYAVGYVELEFNYVAADGSERVIPVTAWYPAAADSGAPPATYAVAGIVELPATDALDAPPVAEGSFPVAVYSHGSGGEALLAYPFGERFASHGWITYSAGHIGNTALDGLNGTLESFARMMLHRPTDVSVMLDRVESGFGGAPVAAASDLSDVFLFGHSFGGYTTFAVGGVELDYEGMLDICSPSDCAFLEEPDVAEAMANLQDPRIDAIAPQAPALYGNFITDSYGALSIPTMLQSGKLDLTTPDATEAQPAWDALANAEDQWVDLPFGAHYSFITICHDLDPELLVLFQPNNEADGCGPQFTPTTEAVPALATYLLAYARTHILGETEYRLIFEGESLHPEFEVSGH